MNALVWRLARQNYHEFSEGKRGKRVNSRSSKQYAILRGRSMCPDCKHELAAKDLVPLLSWLELRGRCRYCQKSIHWQYPAVELTTAILFIASYYFWPFNLVFGWQTVLFGLWLGIVVIMVALAVYDLRWMILPDKLVYILVVLSLLFVAIAVFVNPNQAMAKLVALALVCSFGLFYVLFQLSNGKWIGGGDVKISAALGLLLLTPINVFLMIFLASLGGSLVALPLLLSGKATRTSRIPFGPFLLAATFLVFLFGSQIISWYTELVISP